MGRNRIAPPPDERKPSPRPSARDGEKAMRVEWVLTMRLQGAKASDLFALVNADGEPLPLGHGRAWGVTARTLRNYVRRADALLQGRLAGERENLIALHRGMRRMLYARQVAAAQYADALRTLDSEAKLLGLFP